MTSKTHYTDIDEYCEYVSDLSEAEGLVFVSLAGPMEEIMEIADGKERYYRLSHMLAGELTGYYLVDLKYLQAGSPLVEDADSPGYYHWTFVSGYTWGEV